CSLAPACLPEEARRAAVFAETASTATARESLAVSITEFIGSDDQGESEQAIEDDQENDLGLPSQAVSELKALAPIDTGQPTQQTLLRLFPEDDRRHSPHVVTPGAKVGRAQLEITAKDQPKQRYPIREVGQVVLHGFSQITTQALRLCADKNVS